MHGSLHVTISQPPDGHIHYFTILIPNEYLLLYVMFGSILYRSEHTHTSFGKTIFTICKCVGRAANLTRTLPRSLFQPAIPMLVYIPARTV